MTGSFQARLLIDCKNVLGEGIQWNPSLQRLFWTDIFGNTLWSCDENGERIERLSLPGGLCAFAFKSSGEMLCAFSDGLYDFDPASGRRSLLAEYQPDLGERTRMNDAGLDRKGRFIVGGIDEEGMHPVTDIWSYSGENPRTLLTGVGCANSIVFSPDGSLMYFADTRERDIFVFDYDQEAGIPSNKRLFASLYENEGKPDGSLY